jgi:hypothetical protein
LGVHHIPQRAVARLDPGAGVGEEICLPSLVGGKADPTTLERQAAAGHRLDHRCPAGLTLGGHWVGTGKWLLRELQDLDRDLAEQ